MTTETQLTEQQAEDLFNKAFSEIHKSQGKTTIDYEASAFRETPPEPAKAASPAPDPVVEPPKEPEKKESPEAPEPPKEAEKQPAEKATPPTQPNTLDSFLSNFPEDKRNAVRELIARADQAEQRFRSTSGRLHVERLERKQLNRELAELRQRVSNPAPQDPALAKQTAADSIKSIEEWDQVIKAEPTLAKAVDALTDAKVNAASAKLREEIEARTQPLYDQSEDDVRQAELDKLYAAVPNIGQVIASNEFNYWKNNIAPPAFKSIIENSVKFDDAMAVLHAYAPWAQEVERQRQPQAPAAAAAPAAASAPSPEADALAKQRDNKSAAAVTPNGNIAINTAANRSAGFDTEEAANAYFLQAYEKVRRK